MNKRERMYLDYKYELCAMDGLDGLRAPEEAYLLDVKATKLRPDLLEWIPIEVFHKEVGFLLIARGEPYAKHGEDYRIQETYVKPEYRKRGLMTSAVKSFFKGHPGRYSLEIMVSNPDAGDFWMNLIGKNRFDNNAILHHDNGVIDMIERFFTIEENYDE